MSCSAPNKYCFFFVPMTYSDGLIEFRSIVLVSYSQMGVACSDLVYIRSHDVQLLRFSHSLAANACVLLH
jgi:hypothetical protein